MNVSAEDVNSPSDFVFVLNPDGTTYTITEYKNTVDKDVVIPKFHTDGKMITGIGEYSFQTMGLTSVALHNAINLVGDYAFEGNGIEVLYFSEYSVANVQKRGIIYTSSVGGTPSAGLQLGAYSFANNNLSEVQLANGLTTIGTSAFENNELSVVTLPNTTKVLGDKAFFSNQIAEIILPSSITSLGNYAFKDNGLTAVTFQGNLPAILGTDIFGLNDGLSLRTIAVPSGQLNVFKSAATLLGVQSYALYDPSVPQDPTAYDGTWHDSSLNINESDINPVSDFTFTFNSTTNSYTITGYTNTTDKTVVLPKYHTDGKLITGIGSRAFQTKALTSIALPNSITTIGDRAFNNNLITSLIIPASVTHLNDYTFTENRLISVTFLGAKPALNRYTVFSSNPTLTVGTVKVPSAYLTSYQASFNEFGFAANNVIGILDNDVNLEGGLGYRWESTLNGWEVFHHQNKANKNIVIPSARLDGKPIVSIAANTFDAAGLTSLTLSNGLKQIKSQAFRNNNLTVLSLPESLTRIEDRAFVTNQITSLIIPASVTYISEYAFSSNKLASLTFNGAKPTLYRFFMFSNNQGLTAGTVRVPSAYLSSYQASSTDLGFSASNVIVGY